MALRVSADAVAALNRAAPVVFQGGKQQAEPTAGTSDKQLK